ncbi:MAG: sensor histidine kinase, partial [Gaiellaceae bacterium]
VETATQARADSQEQLRRFVADASHELRTPLTTIRGYADLYRQGANSAEQTDTAMSRIEHEAVRMTALVEDLLLLARLDQNRPLNTDSVDIALLVGQAVDAARAVEPTRPIKLDVMGNGGIHIRGDAARLRQAIDNLLANVRAHTAPEAGASVRVGAADGQVTIEVADEGPGMSDEDARHAFERFYQAAGSSARSGTGLGLAITAAIVEAHHGRIGLSTDLGVGTTFTITLRVADVSSRQA